MTHSAVGDRRARAAEFEKLNRLAIGLAAASGIVVIACLTGLPAATCTAMAQTYEVAIHTYGASSYLAIIVFGAMAIRERMWSKTDTKFGYGLITFAFALFIAASVSGVNNLQLTTAQCFFGSEAELAKKQHQQISVVAPLEPEWWSTVFSLSKH